MISIENILIFIVIFILLKKSFKNNENFSEKKLGKAGDKCGTKYNSILRTPYDCKYGCLPIKDVNIKDVCDKVVSKNTVLNDEDEIRRTNDGHLCTSSDLELVRKYGNHDQCESDICGCDENTGNCKCLENPKCEVSNNNALDVIDNQSYTKGSFLDEEECEKKLGPDKCKKIKFLMCRSGCLKKKSKNNPNNSIFYAGNHESCEAHNTCKCNEKTNNCKCIDM